MSRYAVKFNFNGNGEQKADIEKYLTSSVSAEFKISSVYGVEVEEDPYYWEECTSSEGAAYVLRSSGGEIPLVMLTEEESFGEQAFLLELNKKGRNQLFPAKDFSCREDILKVAKIYAKKALDIRHQPA